MRKNIFVTGIIAVSIALLAGCSDSPEAAQPESEPKQEADNKEAATAKLDESSAETTEQESAIGIGTLRPEAVAYFGTTYGDFLNKGGEEGEFLHAGRYIAKCPDLDADVIYLGVWHEDDAVFSIEDTSEFLRLDGNVAAFFSGKAETLTADEFLKQLEENYIVTSEYRESGGTAYYVSDTDYLHIELTGISAEVEDAVVEIACKEGESISPDSYCWVMEKTDNSNILSEMPTDFVFSSGAGGWSTDIQIAEDGSFTGEYHDSDMGVTGDGYSNGTLYICTFSGRFSVPEPTYKQNIYSMKLLEIKINDEEKIGTEEIVDETLYVYTTPYGLDNADEFLIYTPGAPLSDMTEECRSWIFLSSDIFKEVPDGYYVIYNIGGEEAFTGQSNDAVWYRDFVYENGNAYVNFSPSYYMGSYFSFFTEHNAPSALSLSLPWDGKSTEPMECKKSWEDDGTRVKVTIEPDAGSTPETLKYLITVESITDPQFDFSAWGSNEPGKFSAVFTEKKD